MLKRILGCRHVIKMKETKPSPCDTTGCEMEVGIICHPHLGYSTMSLDTCIPHKILHTASIKYTFGKRKLRGHQRKQKLLSSMPRQVKSGICTFNINNYHHGEEMIPPGLSVRKEDGSPIEKGVPDFLFQYFHGHRVSIQPIHH